VPIADDSFSEPLEQVAWCATRSAIESELVLVKIALEVFAADGALICAKQYAL